MSLNSPGTMSLAEGLAIQHRHLEQWQTCLKPSVFKKVQAEAKKRNKKLAEDKREEELRYKAVQDNWGYKVWRGEAITQFVCQLMAKG